MLHRPDQGRIVVIEDKTFSVTIFASQKFIDKKATIFQADVGQKKAAGGGNLLQTIAHILGVNDISQLNPDANLGDLGLDSLMGVEIKQALERDYDIVLSMKVLSISYLFGTSSPLHLVLRIHVIFHVSFEQLQGLSVDGFRFPTYSSTDSP